jgi:hypothetical protein
MHILIGRHGNKKQDDPVGDISSEISLMNVTGTTFEDDILNLSFAGGSISSVASNGVSDTATRFNAIMLQIRELSSLPENCGASM